MSRISGDEILKRTLSNETSVCSRLKVYSFSFFWIGVAVKNNVCKTTYICKLHKNVQLNTIELLYTVSQLHKF